MTRTVVFNLFIRESELHITKPVKVVLDLYIENKNSARDVYKRDK